MILSPRTRRILLIVCLLVLFFLCNVRQFAIYDLLLAVSMRSKRF